MARSLRVVYVLEGLRHQRCAHKPTTSYSPPAVIKAGNIWQGWADGRPELVFALPLELRWCSGSCRSMNADAMRWCGVSCVCCLSYIPDVDLVLSWHILIGWCYLLISDQWGLTGISRLDFQILLSLKSYLQLQLLLNFAISIASLISWCFFFSSLVITVVLSNSILCPVSVWGKAMADLLTWLFLHRIIYLLYRL